MTDFADLISGYQRFRKSGWSNQRERWAELAEGQAPRIMVIACSDSRVDPSTIFDASPGEMFVVRNVANLVPPFELGGGRHGVSAALEFAVTQLEVSEILVMGHGACGGCSAALSQNFKNAKPGEGGFISRWIDMLDDARAKVVDEYGTDQSPAAIRAMEHEAVKVSLANLRTFACIREREATGQLALHGAWFAIDGGELFVLDEAKGTFQIA
ncbi:carbonic anhydrase [Aquisediminimonas profunda]|uniref:carbonic anhydrase n=1 Tax=Aquisediminimonas profunda TaxID=1550733 RepID=UPI001C6306B0|nr:carbonic anhydrase [Aquisediminimonas profunda]